MTTTTYLVLASLLDGPRHGYAIVQHAATLSEGSTRLTTGTLYGALERLQREGLIEDAGQEAIDGRLRRYYRLTDAGADQLREQTAQMQRTAAAVAPQLAQWGLTS